MSNEKWSEDDGSHDVELSALVREALRLIAPSAALDERILASTRHEMSQSGSLELTAANDPVFSPVHLELLAASDGAERLSTSISHEVGGVTYGEIQMEQFEDEIDFIYKLVAEYRERYANCSVSLNMGERAFILGPLDAEGKATLTVKMSTIPVQLSCQFLPPSKPPE